MKKFTTFLTIAFLFFGLSAYSKVITVSNTTNSPGQYKTIQEALIAASAGDTIYVSGSSASYGTIDINKKIVLIGAGFNPNNQFNLNSELHTVNFRVGDGAMNPTSNPSGSEIVGFKIHTIYTHNDNINNVKINRNHITSSIYFYSKTLKDWVLKNNIIHNIDAANLTTNMVIANNIITGTITSFKSTTISISNNILTGTGNGLNYVEYAIVTNNIYITKSTAGCNYCTFNNNISVGGTHTTFTYGNNTGQNNLENTNPLFVYAPSHTFSFDHDYHLQSTSPGKDAGTDGKDIGIYGGIFSFPGGEARPWQTSPVPAIPQVLKMNVKNSVLPENGTLQVEIEAVSNP
jgi:hypothetical protein